ncbi:dihydropteroate synthase [Streptomyces adonidis]|uniref:dihydropteroate synthase n=1 Tax=Streptomyces adonidis TaxID=3231367 RepID=UPI0034DB3F23
MSTVQGAAVGRSRTPMGLEGLAWLGRRLFMGILNATPDFFSGGGLYEGDRCAVDRGLELTAQVADIVHVGGESTRSGVRPAGPEEELARTVPVVRELARADVCVNVDTMHASVARAAVEAGASLVNDVSGDLVDPAVASTVAAVGAPYAAMHWRAPSPETDRHADHRDVVAEVGAELGRHLKELTERRVGPFVDAALAGVFCVRVNDVPSTADAVRMASARLDHCNRDTGQVRAAPAGAGCGLYP